MVGNATSHFLTSQEELHDGARQQNHQKSYMVSGGSTPPPGTINDYTTSKLVTQKRQGEGSGPIMV